MKISAEGATPNSEGRKPWINRHYLECEVCRTDTYYIILYYIIFIRRRTYGAH